jgi:leucyl aminopeptidase
MIKNYKPEYIVDIATLTGSSVGTLGYEWRFVLIMKPF